MREIQFRAWDKKNKKMIDKRPYSPDHYEFLYVNFEGEIELTHRGLPDYTKDFILMQYIGLKDKKGKEICESDIVEVSGRWNGYNGEFIVVYEAPCFTIADKDGSDSPYMKFTDDDWNECEVIGNIHENPELMEDKKERDLLRT